MPIVATLLLGHISNHIIHLPPTLSLSFLIIFLLINLSPYNYFSSNISLTFNFLSPLYQKKNFLSPHYSTLTLQFLHPFIFLLFWIFLSSYFVYTKRWVLSHSLFFFFSFLLADFYSLLRLYFKLMNFCVELYFELMWFGCVLIFFLWLIDVILWNYIVYNDIMLFYYVA